MKFLLLQPPLFDVPFNKSQPSPGHLLSIYSYLKRNNRDLMIDVLDLTQYDSESADEGKNLLSDTLKKQFKKYSPDVLGISCYTSFHYIVSQLIALIFKEENPAGIVIAGGYHPTVVPTDFTYAGAPYDYVIRGEGEIALSRLLIQPLCPQHQAKIIKGTPLNIETEELLWDDYPLFKKGVAPPTQLGPGSGKTDRHDEKVSFSNKLSQGISKQKGEKIVLFLSRGCPFRCNFCLEPSKMSCSGSHYRVYSSAKARQTVETIVKKLSPYEIFFADPIFGLFPHWRRQLLKDLADVAADVPLWAETRIDTFSREDVDLLKPLRFRLDFGLDAIVPDNILRQNKSRNPQKYIRQFKNLDDCMNSQKIPHSVFLLYNYPGETPQTYFQTRQTVLDIGKNRAYNYTCFVGQSYSLYPGSTSYQQMKHYEVKYGSRFPNDGWWREITDDRYTLATSIVASRNMAGKKIDFRRDIDQLFAETIPDQNLIHWPHGDE